MAHGVDVDIYKKERYGSLYEEYKKLREERDHVENEFNLEKMRFRIEEGKVALDLLKRGEDPEEATDIVREKRKSFSS